MKKISKRSQKLVSILLTLSFLVAMLIPMAVPALASSTISAASVAALSADKVYTGATVNRVTVEIPMGQLIGGTSFRLTAPTDFGFTINSNNIPAVTNGNQVATASAIGVGIPFVATDANNVTATVYNSYEIALTENASAGGEGYVTFNINQLYVPSGKTGDVALTIDAAPGSAVTSGSVLIGTVGSGNVELAMASVKTVSDTSSGSVIDNIKIKEDRAGALDATSATSIKIKLPNGFTWDKSGASSVYVWGTTATVPALNNLTLSSDERTLQVRIPAASTAATYFTLNGLKIKVDDTIAKTGDIVATVSGDSTISTDELTVGTYGNYGVTVAGFGDPTTVTKGMQDQEIGKISIEESLPGSLVGGRTITLSLSGGAKWNTYPKISSADSSNTKGLTFQASGTNGDVIKATVIASSDAATYVLKGGSVNVSPAAGDITLTVGGTAGASGDVVVAKATAAVTASIEGDLAKIVIGEQAQALPDYVVTETGAESVDSSVYYNQLNLEFPMDVLPSLPTKVEVVDGDIVLDQNSIMRGVTADGRWYIGITVKSTSSVASKIKFSGIKVNVSRTLPEGPMNVAVKGGSVVQTLADFPGYTAAAVAQVGTVVTPASNETKANATFVIGSTTYTVDGVSQTMDVAPYIKDGRTYLPVRYVAQALGVSDDNILWDGNSNTVTLLKGTQVVQMTIGSNKILVNGATITMDAAPEITSSRTMLPIRFIAQALGATVSWDAATQTVTLN